MGGVSVCGGGECGVCVWGGVSECSHFNIVHVCNRAQVLNLYI